MLDASFKSIQCIAVYDSGVGGLVALHSLKKYFAARYLYFADTLHFPYGNKSFAQLKEIGAYNISLLLPQADTVVIACHTISAVYKQLDTLKHPKIINVVDLLLNQLIHTPNIQKLGILATQATVESGVYQKELALSLPHVTYVMQACPGLADMIEYEQHELIKKQLSLYVAPLVQEGIDTLALACTHYELIAHILPDIVGKHVSIITLQDSFKRYALSCNKYNMPIDKTIQIVASDQQELFEARALAFMEYAQDVLQDAVLPFHQEYHL